MLTGDKKQWLEFVTKWKDTDPSRVERVSSLIQWVSDNTWFVPQDKDSLFDKSIQQEMVATGGPVTPSEMIGKLRTRAKEAAETRKAKTVVTAGTPRVLKVDPPKLPAGAPALPPAVKPPRLFSKVAQYWKTTHGPKVSLPIYESRFSKCTKEGGYMWSTVSGLVASVIQENGVWVIVIGNATIRLPAGEEPNVVVGQEVLAGQVIGKGSEDKKCQYLLTDGKGGTVKYYCNACGCGVRQKAELTSKLWWARLQCPRTPPLFTPEAENADQTASDNPASSDSQLGK